MPGGRWPAGTEGTRRVTASLDAWHLIRQDAKQVQGELDALLHWGLIWGGGPQYVFSLSLPWSAGAGLRVVLHG